MTTLLDLAERVERLTGPDREVDALIACATKFPLLEPATPESFGGKYGYRPGDIEVPTGFLMAYSYTRSLDDAMTLVPDLGEVDGRRFDLFNFEKRALVRCFSDIDTHHQVAAATPALALTAAALRARAHIERTEHE